MTNKFKRYAYFSRLEYTDILRLSTWEYTSNQIIDDVVKTLSLPKVSLLTLGDIFAVAFLPIRIIIMLAFCSWSIRNHRKISKRLSQQAREEKHISGMCLYTVDWKRKFKRSKPTSYNDY